MTENIEGAPGPEARPPLSWAERHGAVLLSAGLGLVLILVLILDWLIRGPR